MVDDEEPIEWVIRTVRVITASGHETKISTLAQMFPITVSMFSRDGVELWCTTVDDPGNDDDSPTMDLRGFWYVIEEQGPITCVVTYGDGTNDMISASGVHYGADEAH
jgi:hypothetical protein